LTALRRSAALDWFNTRVRGPISARIDRTLRRLSRRAAGRTVIRRVPPRRITRLAVGLLLVVVARLGVLPAVRLLAQLPVSAWQAVGVGALATRLRTTLALVVGAAWTVPVGVAIGLNPRWAERLQPLVQIVASIPATAIFPALLLVLLGLPRGLSLAAVAFMLLGTQWYILFNVIAGAMAIPSDLREAAAIYKLGGWRRWRYLILATPS
jgi:NitT/TauT family transport system permease protein